MNAIDLRVGETELENVEMSFNAFRVSNRFTISPYLYAGEQEELLTPVIYKLIAATRKRVRQGGSPDTALS